MTDYKDIAKLINDGDYQEAYEMCNHLIEQGDKNAHIYYLRGAIDFNHLKEHLDVTKDDFVYAISHSKRYAKELAPRIVILADALEDADNVIKYSEQALTYLKNETEEFVSNIHFMIARAYFLSADNLDDYLSALHYINSAITSASEVPTEFRLCKVDILMMLERYNEALVEIDDIFAKEALQATFYYVKSRVLLGLAENDHLKAEEALDQINIYLNYEENNYYGLLVKASILKLLGKTNDAIKIYQSVMARPNASLTEEDITIEIIRTLDEANDLDDARKTANEYLEKHESWKIEYILASVINERTHVFSELEEALTLLNHCYTIAKEPMIAVLKGQILRKMRRDTECYEWLKKCQADFPEDGRWDYYLADAALKINLTYDVALDYYRQSYQKHFITEIEYLDMATIYASKPNKYYKRLNRYAKSIQSAMLKTPFAFQIGSYFKMAVRRLYGSKKLTIDYNQAMQYAKFCYDNVPNDCCCNTLYGRVLELAHREKEAFVVYENAYKQDVAAYLPLCHCSFGYYAHALIKGIGTNVDIDKAAALVKVAFEMDGITSDSSIVYLYTYFALLEYDGFDIKKAKKALQSTGCILRYEITRHQLLLQVCDKLHDEKGQNEAKKGLKLALKYDNKAAVQYYRLHANDQIFYPFLNNY